MYTIFANTAPPVLPLEANDGDFDPRATLRPDLAKPLVGLAHDAAVALKRLLVLGRDLLEQPRAPLAGKK